MARIVVLTSGKVPGRQGPPSARYEIGRNNALAESLLRRGHDVWMWWDEPEGELDTELPDLAVLRSGRRVNLGRARQLRENGAVVLNDPDRHDAASDKWLSVALFAEAGIAHPNTTLAMGPLSDQIVVLKERRSSGGRGVALCPGSDVPDDERYVTQQKIDWSDDLRAMVVDGRVQHWLRRRPAPGEWRTNLAQGASYETAHDVPSEVEQLALGAARATGLLWCGVDLLCSNGAWLVLEANPGTTFHGVTVEEGRAVVESVADAIERRLPS